MGSSRNLHNRESAFSMVEILVVLAILITMAGVITPYVLDAIDKAKVAKLLKIYDNVKRAVETYRLDILTENRSMGMNDLDTVPREWEDNPTDPSYPHNAHNLFYRPQGVGNWADAWNGPYLNEPLRQSGNPYGGEIILVAVDWPSGDGNEWYPQGTNWPPIAGNGSYTGNACVLFFTNIPESQALLFDDELDPTAKDGLWWELFGGGNAWQKLGRAKWDDNRTLPLPGGGGPLLQNGVLSILVVDLDGR